MFIWDSLHHCCVAVCLVCDMFKTLKRLNKLTCIQSCEKVTWSVLWIKVSSASSFLRSLLPAWQKYSFYDPRYQRQGCKNVLFLRSIKLLYYFIYVPLDKVRRDILCCLVSRLWKLRSSETMSNPIYLTWQNQEGGVRREIHSNLFLSGMQRNLSRALYIWEDLWQAKLTSHSVGRHCHGKWNNNKKWQTSVPWCGTVWLVHCLWQLAVILGDYLGVLVISTSASWTITVSALCLDRLEPLRSKGDFNQVGFHLGVD